MCFQITPKVCYDKRAQKCAMSQFEDADRKEDNFIMFNWTPYGWHFF